MFYEEVFTKSQCNCCQQTLTGLNIECAECPNTFRLCRECFSLGAEVGQHKQEHRYRFFDSGSLVLFPKESNWSAREEIRLLDAIEQYGFGNWQDISKHIESKTSNEAKEEYVKRFVQGSIGQSTWSNCIEKVQRPVDRTTRDDGPLSPSLTQKLPPLDIASDEAAQLGYMPQRDDYEKEFDNDAEKLVSQLVFSSEDEEVDISLKLALVDMYSRRLRERARRKRVIRDYQLVSQFFKKDRPSQKRLFASSERELQEQFKPFAQFHSAREHENFIQNLVKEKDLKFRLGECYKYRRNGITRVSDCTEFERIKSRKRTSQGPNTANNNNTSNEISTSLSKIPEQTEDRNQGMNSQVARTSALLPTLLTTATPTGVKRRGDEDYYQDRNNIAHRFSCDDYNLKCEGLTSEVHISQTQAVQELEQNSWQLHREGKQRDMEGQFIANVNSLPSVQLLSSPEKHLCISANLQPSQYLTIKTALLLSQSPVTFRLGRPSNLSDLEWNKVVNFVASSGWIQNASSEAE